MIQATVQAPSLEICIQSHTNIVSKIPFYFSSYQENIDKFLTANGLYQKQYPCLFPLGSFWENIQQRKLILLEMVVDLWHGGEYEWRELIPIWAGSHRWSDEIYDKDDTVDYSRTLRRIGHGTSFSFVLFFNRMNIPGATVLQRLLSSRPLHILTLYSRERWLHPSHSPTQLPPNPHHAPWSSKAPLLDKYKPIWTC